MCPADKQLWSKAISWPVIHGIISCAPHFVNVVHPPSSYYTGTPWKNVSELLLYYYQFAPDSGAASVRSCSMQKTAAKRGRVSKPARIVTLLALMAISPFWLFVVDVFILCARKNSDRCDNGPRGGPRASVQQHEINVAGTGAPPPRALAREEPRTDQGESARVAAAVVLSAAAAAKAALATLAAAAGAASSKRLRNGLPQNEESYVKSGFLSVQHLWQEKKGLAVDTYEAPNAHRAGLLGLFWQPSTDRAPGFKSFNANETLANLPAKRVAVIPLNKPGTFADVYRPPGDGACFCHETACGLFVRKAQFTDMSRCVFFRTLFVQPAPLGTGVVAMKSSITHDKKMLSLQAA